MLYFIDGYHGGIRGHMPSGAWQDILYALEKYPEWKISLEIEPESFDYLKSYDYGVYKRLSDFLQNNATSHRTEIISGSHSQPFCWAVNGESNIRQLLYGRKIHEKHFPECEIDTYAVQEPCFTSSLPQILSKMGYRRMVLKNPTAWGGYLAKMPEGIINLYSSDGSFLPAVTRYECEELFSCSVTEASGYDPRIKDFADKCIKNGIEFPAGMCLQDLGWSSKPIIKKEKIDVEYVTWREYFYRFLPGIKVNTDIHFTQDDICVSLPWGNQIFQNMLRKVRRTENYILQIEKFLSLSENQTETDAEISYKNSGKLEHAWNLLMKAQHHDGYICATTKTWAYESGSFADVACGLLDDIKENIVNAYVSSESQLEELIKKNKKSDEIWVKVFNTTGNTRKDIAYINLGLDHGYKDIEVYDKNDNTVNSQFRIIRKFEDGCIGAVSLSFESQLDGMGYETYKVLLKTSESDKADRYKYKKDLARIENNNLIMENSETLVVFDLHNGGAIMQYIDKQTGTDYVKGVKDFGSIRGYSIKKDKFISNTETEVKCEILENGEVYAKVRLSGHIAETGFSTLITLENGNKKLDIETSLHFSEETYIGYPYTPAEGEKYHGTKRSSCREDYKMSVYMPFTENNTTLYKSAPYDICKSLCTDTRFDSWEDIKHSVINGYVDLYDEKKNTGMFVYCDCVNGYSFYDNIFTLTLAFGYHANFWWGCQPLKGVSRIKYSLLPHQGNFADAALNSVETGIKEPLISFKLPHEPYEKSKYMIKSENKNIEVVTVYKDNGNYIVRLFNASDKDEILDYTCNIPSFKDSIIDLNGNLLSSDKKLMNKTEIRTLI